MRRTLSQTRKQARLSKDALADRLGVTVSWLSALELDDDNGVAPAAMVERAMLALDLASLDIVASAEDLSAAIQRATDIAGYVRLHMSLEGRELTDEAVARIMRKTAFTMVAKMEQPTGKLGPNYYRLNDSPESSCKTVELPPLPSVAEHTPARGDTNIRLAEEDRESLVPALSGIQLLAEVDEWESINIASALIWLQSHPYSTSTELLDVIALREIHKRMFEDVWTWAGRFRRRETNIGVSPDQITTQLAVLLGNTEEQVSQNTFSPEELCVRFHFALVSIHCFPNGNGRHARLVTDELRRTIGQSGLPFTWGCRSGLSGADRRRRYLHALRVADTSGRFDELLELALA